MKSLPGTYLLSMIDHKGRHKFSSGFEIFVAKQMDNNLRDRNPQLGKVEGIPEDNELNLSIGDIVAVNHFTFYGGIGKDKSNQLQPHSNIDGNNIFKVRQDWIYFKFNDFNPELIPGFTLCKDVEEKKTIKFNGDDISTITYDRHFDNKGVVMFGDNKDRKILVKNYSMYLIELYGVDYFKVMDREIVAFIDNGVPVPTKKCILVQYHEWKNNSIIDLSGAKKPNSVKARVVNGNGNFSDGEVLLVWRNNGVKYGDYWVIDIDDDIILGSWGVHSEHDIENLTLVA